MEPNGRASRHAHMNDQHAPHSTLATGARRPISTSRSVTTIGSIALLALVLAACRAGGGAGSGGDAGDGGGGGEANTDGSQLVLRIENAGGFVPREYALSAVPELTILADGRVITMGPQIAIYPGPALPNLQQRRLTQAGVDEVVRAVLESGYFEQSADFQGAGNFIADAHTTYFTLVNEGSTVNVSVYGLGTVDPSHSDMLPADEVAVHEKLQSLRDRMMGLETWLPDTAWEDAEYSAFVPAALRVHVRSADADPEQVDVEPERRSWPLATPLAEFGAEGGQDAPDLRCGVVTGAEANQLLEAMAQANQITRWESGGAEYAVIVRPLLPDEPADCG